MTELDYIMKLISTYGFLLLKYFDKKIKYRSALMERIFHFVAQDHLPIISIIATSSNNLRRSQSSIELGLATFC